MQERRKQPRKDLMSYSQVFELYHGKLIGYLGDITFLGAMVIGDEPFEMGSQMNISIQLPELPDVNATRMALPVRVVYCQKDISPEYYNIGLEFSLVTDQQKKIIESIIENYEFRRQTPKYPPRPV
ncbi:MAG: PilZ domain-containing protein [Syntrophothermus sp.]